MLKLEERGPWPANKPPFRLIVAGGRDFDDYDTLKLELDKILEEKSSSNNVIIISGAAAGADKLGERWAGRKKIKCVKYPASWDYYKNQAGIIRNEQMANNADACIVFWDGKSKGTAHMIKMAKKYNLELKVIKYQKLINEGEI